MRDPNRAVRIVEAVVKAVSVPVTVKMRSGWDENSINCCQIAVLAEEAGAHAVTVHPAPGNSSFPERPTGALSGR